MLRKFLIAAAIVIANPAFVSAQDIFWSLSSTELVSTSTENAATSGSAYIFSDGLFGFDTLDLDFSTSDSSVITFTGGEAFNPTFTNGGMRFTSSQISIDSATNTGTLFSVNFSQNGVNPAVGPFFDPGFDFGVGPNGAVLLARVDFDIVGDGVAELDFTLGPQGALQLPLSPLNPSFGSASIETLSGPGVLLGDVNMDGVVDCFDIMPFIMVLFTGGFQAQADIGGNGVVNFFDINPFVEILVGN